METNRASVGTGRHRLRRATHYPSLQTASACEIRHSRHSGDCLQGQQARPRTVQGGNEPQGSPAKCETRIPRNSARQNVYGPEDRSRCSKYGLLQTWGVYIKFSRSYFGNQTIKYLWTCTKGGVVVFAPNVEGSLLIPLLHLGLHL